MQIMVDLLQETPEALRLLAQFVTDHATLREAMEAGGQVPPAPTAPVVIPTPPASVPAGTPSIPNPPSATVLPFAAPAASNTAMVPPAPNVTQLPVSPPSTLPTSTNGTAAALEFDSAGMPWDARIHQVKRGKKKDGTWKLQKGIDANIVTAVTQEWHAKRLTPGAVGATAPVSVPQTQAQGESEAEKIRRENETRAAAYAASQAGQGQTPTIPPAPVVIPPAPQGETPPVIPPAPPLHVQPAATVGVPDPNNTGVLPPVTELRALISKISNARNSQPPKLTADELSGVLQQAGVPSLQLLGSMTHKVAEVDMLVDSIILTR